MKRSEVKRKLFEVVEKDNEWSELAQAAVDYILELEDHLFEVQDAANR